MSHKEYEEIENLGANRETLSAKRQPVALFIEFVVTESHCHQ
jgi:hypothetical protein